MGHILRLSNGLCGAIAPTLTLPSHEGGNHCPRHSGENRNPLGRLRLTYAFFFPDVPLPEPPEGDQSP